MGSASLAAARPAARTVTTIPLQPEGLRGKKWKYFIYIYDVLKCGVQVLKNIAQMCC